MSRRRKVLRIQSATPQQNCPTAKENDKMKSNACPYDLDSFETFDVTSKGKQVSKSPAYLVFSQTTKNGLQARITLSQETVQKMHDCMEFDDRVEYRVNETLRVIALLPKEDGVKLSKPSSKKKRGTRYSISVCKAKDPLKDMFGAYHIVYLVPEYFDGVTILRPTGETEGTLEGGE